MRSWLLRMFTRRLACMTCQNVPLTILKSLLLANELTLNTDFWCFDVLRNSESLPEISMYCLILTDLQQTATDCNTRTTLHHAATNCTTLHHTAPHCTPLHPTAPHCTPLQHIATHCHTPQPTPWALPAPAPHCNTLQHTATHFNLPHGPFQPLHPTATHCTPLHHTATHCNTLKRNSTCPMGPSSPYAHRHSSW